MKFNELDLPTLDDFEELCKTCVAATTGTMKRLRTLASGRRGARHRCLLILSSSMAVRSFIISGSVKLKERGHYNEWQR